MYILVHMPYVSYKVFNQLINTILYTINILSLLSAVSFPADRTK